jgi:hypothetical protein
MNPIADTTQQSPYAARRERQLTEIARLVVAGRHERASGLALVHINEFPEDADLLASVTHPG